MTARRARLEIRLTVCGNRINERSIGYIGLSGRAPVEISGHEVGVSGGLEKDEVSGDRLAVQNAQDVARLDV